jgi:hypothetical protein
MTLMVSRALMRLVALWLGIAPALGLLPVGPPLTADAFNPPVHKAIFEQALADKFSPEARDWVKVGLEQSDRPFGHFYAQLHFDSALNREQVCQRVKDGPRFLLSRAAEAAIEAPTDPLPRSLITALTLYGQYIHAIMDFYSHSNWIELHVAKGEKPETLPILTEQGACNPATLPEELTTGYFSPWYGLDGCPDTGPPGAFRYCHGPTVDPTRQLAKDVPNEFHGADKLPGGTAICPEDPCTRTYHDEAKRLATEATHESWPTFKATIEAAMQRAFPDRDAACLFTWLVQGGDPTCPKLQGRSEDLYFQTASLAPGAVEAYWLEGEIGGILADWKVEDGFSSRVQLNLGEKTIEDGAISFAMSNAREGMRWEHTGVGASGAYGTLAPDIGLIDFEGKSTTFYSDGRAPYEWNGLWPFHFAFTNAGQLVLCGLRHSTREACLAQPFAVLEPAGGGVTPPTPPIT